MCAQKVQLSSRRIAILLWALLLPGTTAQAQQPSSLPPLHADAYPLSQVHAGLHGTAWTVFEGTQPEPMDVEILGVLKDSIGPGQDMILARLHGTKPEYTGIVAGMSGSPVYIDGKLLGSLSFRIGQFSKEPIAGITPIEQMFQVRDLPGIPAPSSPPSTPATPAAANQSAIRPIASPLVFAGFSKEAVALIQPKLEAEGLEPVAGLGSVDTNARQPDPVLPGSAISAIFARGDLSVAATCTVTYIDPQRLLACGHPITQFGGILAPMAKATVLATLPSPLNAFKIVNTTETVGAFTQDRASAILGHFGEEASMIPVTISLTPEETAAGPSRTLHFELVKNRQLTPQLVLASVFQSLNGTNTSGAEMSFDLHGELKIADHEPLKLHAMLSPADTSSGAVQSAIFLYSRFEKVFANPLEEPTLQSLELHAQAIPHRMAAEIESARLNMEEATAGKPIQIEVTVHPYQQPARVIRIPVMLPSTLTEGNLRILVSDAATLDKLSLPTAVPGQHPINLTDTIAGLNRMHDNDRVYISLLENEAQANTATMVYPDIPASIANAIQPERASNTLSLHGESAVEVANVPLHAAISGSQILTIRIR